MRLFLPAALVLWTLSAAAQTPAGASDLEAVITTDAGTFRLEFAPDKAPKHVEQFIARAKAGYYDGSGFFRVVADGMIQGGDPLLKNPKTPRNLWGTGGLNLLPTELSDFKHDRGVVSTVSIPGKPDSDGAQFFICVIPQPSLDGHYSSFGKVTEGMDVVERISRTPAKDGITERPVTITAITIEPKKREPFIDAPVSALKRTVTLNTTLGAIKIQTEPAWAPENARNFLKLSASGWYNGIAFHRIAKGFVVQGGAADQRQPGVTSPADRWVRTVKGEFNSDVKHIRGIVSMAHGDDPDSASTSFFLVLGPSPHLDGKYSAFGRVTQGLDILDAFEKEEVNGETPRRRLEIIDAIIDASVTPE
jgi:cyclophilin family peptidyl-prolyl cis-trans isomerase